ncbi:MAG: hypothetical protein ACLFVY_04695 [Phycisphaerae bacterium]
MNRPLRRTWALVLPALLLTTALTHAGPKPSPQPTYDIPPSFAEDIDSLKETLSLSDKQVKTLTDLAKQRAAAIDKWDAANAKKLEKLRDQQAKVNALAAKAKSKDKKERARAEQTIAYKRRILGAISALNRSRYQLAMGYEKRMFGVLAADQRGRHNADPIAQAVRAEFGDVSLDEKQEAAITDLATKAGARLTLPYNAAEHQSLVVGLQKQVFARVLTKDQRKQIAEARRKDNEDKKKDKTKGKNKDKPRGK